MAERYASQYGNNTDVSRYRDILTAQDGNGDTFGEQPNVVWHAEMFPVTQEEVELLARHSARKDVEFGNISFPPDLEVALKLANNFFDTYLCDTGENRIEMIDRYVAVLIEELADNERAQSLDDEDKIKQYVYAVHEQAEELISATA